MTRPGIEPRTPGPLANTLLNTKISIICTKNAVKTSHKRYIIVNIIIIIIHVQLTGLVGREFANGLGDLGSISGRVKDCKNSTWYLLP